MKKTLLCLLAGTGLLLAGCTPEKFDDSAINKRLDGLTTDVSGLKDDMNNVKNDISQLKQDVQKLQDNVQGFQTLMQKVNEAVYISGVQEIKDANGGVIGYTITFTDKTSVTIYHGTDGTNGTNGQTPYIGQNGNWWIGTTDTGVKAEGKDGQDGKTPYIGQNGNWWMDGQDTGVKAEGKDGVTPKDGETPYIGQNGNWWIGTTDTGVKAEGTDGISPVLGVVLEGNIYYWTITINGVTNYLLDKDGNRVAATANGAAGLDGQTPYIGQNGNWWIGNEDTGVKAEGQDGVGINGKTPEFRLTDEGMLQVTYDTEEPKTWQDLGLLSMKSEVSDQIFTGVKENAEEVIFYLTDGSKLVFPKDLDFVLVFAQTKGLEVAAGATSEIAYTIQGADANTEVDAFGGADWYAEATFDGKAGGKVVVTAGNTAKAKVLVYALNGKGTKTDIKTLAFTGGTLEAVYDATQVPVDGGNVPVSVTTNVDYTVVIPEEASDWVSYVQTKAGAVRTDELVFTLTKNTTPAKRIAEVQLLDVRGSVIQALTFAQEAGSYTAPVFTDENFKKYILDKFDADKDGQLSAEEAGKVTAIDYNEVGSYWDGIPTHGPVSSFDGIEALYNLKTLKVTTPSYGTVGSTAKTLDLRQNKKLEVVNLSLKPLEELNLEGLTHLKEILFPNAAVKTVDVSAAAGLTTFTAYNSALESVDLSHNPELTNLALYGTKITALNTSANPKLKAVSVGTATLASYDFSQNPEITSLSISNSQVASADFSKLTKLTSFTADYTKLENVDLSHSPLLTSFNMSNTKVKKVDVSTAERLNNFTMMSSTVLQEIRFCDTDYVRGRVGSFNYPSGNWQEDETYLSVNVVWVKGTEVVIDDYAALVADSYVRKYILGKYDADADGKLDAAEAATVTELNLSDMALYNIDGLENFPLEVLNLSGNKLTSFTATSFPALTDLDLSGNALTSINLKDATHIERVNLSDNQISGSVGYSQIPYNNIKWVDVSGNASLNFSPYLMDKLEYLDMSNTGASSLSGTASLTNVKYLNIAGTKIAGTINLSSAKALEIMDIRNTGVTQLNLTAAAAAGVLKKVYAKGSKLTMITIGEGDSVPDDLVDGIEGVIIFPGVPPTKELRYNVWNHISAISAGDKAEVADLVINYTTASKGFIIEAGGEGYITMPAGKKGIKFFAVGVNGTPSITLSRSSGKDILTKETDSSYYGESYKSSGPNPFTIRANDSAAKDNLNFIVSGDGDWYRYNWCKAYTSADATVADEVITFKVDGEAGTKAIIFALNGFSMRDDDE